MNTFIKLITLIAAVALILNKFNPEIWQQIWQVIQAIAVMIGMALWLVLASCIDETGRETYGKRDWELVKRRMNSSKKHKALSQKTKNRLLRKTFGF